MNIGNFWCLEPIWLERETHWIQNLRDITKLGFQKLSTGREQVLFGSILKCEWQKTLQFYDISYAQWRKNNASCFRIYFNANNKRIQNAWLISFCIFFDLVSYWHANHDPFELYRLKRFRLCWKYSPKAIGFRKHMISKKKKNKEWKKDMFLMAMDLLYLIVVCNFPLGCCLLSITWPLWMEVMLLAYFHPKEFSKQRYYKQDWLISRFYDLKFFSVFSKRAFKADRILLSLLWSSVIYSIEIQNLLYKNSIRLPWNNRVGSCLKTAAKTSNTTP